MLLEFRQLSLGRTLPQTNVEVDSRRSKPGRIGGGLQPDPDWKKILTDLEDRGPDKAIDDVLAGKETWEIEDRREIYEILAKGDRESGAAKSQIATFAAAVRELEEASPAAAAYGPGSIL